MTGILLTGIFATASISGTSGLLEGNPHLLLMQLYGVAVTLGWTAVATYVLLKLVSLFVPLRVSLQQELEGLDISSTARHCNSLPYFDTFRLPAH